VRGAVFAPETALFQARRAFSPADNYFLIFFNVNKN
jgi:hypothetical protein